MGKKRERRDGLQFKHGSFRYRRAIPGDLTRLAGEHFETAHPKTGEPYLGEYIRPLGTSDYAEADAAADEYRGEIKKLIFAWRRGSIIERVTRAYSGGDVVGREIHAALRALAEQKPLPLVADEQPQVNKKPVQFASRKLFHSDGSKPISAHLDAFIASRTGAPRTLAGIRADMNNFAKLVDDKPVREMTTEDCQRFKVQCQTGHKRQTAVLSFRSLCQYTQWCVANNLLVDDPCAKLRITMRADEDHFDQFPPDELAMMLERFAIDDHRRRYILIAMFTGFDAGEIEKIEPKLFQEKEHRRPHILTRGTKDARHGVKNRTRFFPVAKIILPWLAEWLAHQHEFDYHAWMKNRFLPSLPLIRVTEQGRPLRKAMKSFRHTFRRHLKAVCQSDGTINRLMGHKGRGTGDTAYDPRRPDGIRELLWWESDLIDRIDYEFSIMA